MHAAVAAAASCQLELEAQDRGALQAVALAVNVVSHEAVSLLYIAGHQAKRRQRVWRGGAG